MRCRRWLSFRPSVCSLFVVAAAGGGSSITRRAARHPRRADILSSSPRRSAFAAWFPPNTANGERPGPMGSNQRTFICACDKENVAIARKNVYPSSSLRVNLAGWPRTCRHLRRRTYLRVTHQYKMGAIQFGPGCNCRLHSRASRRRVKRTQFLFHRLQRVNPDS
jgi:hypothetical protein